MKSLIVVLLMSSCATACPIISTRPTAPPRTAEQVFQWCLHARQKAERIKCEAEYVTYMVPRSKR